MKKISGIAIVAFAFAMTMTPAFAMSAGSGTLSADINNNTIFVDGFTLSFQRTLRLPVDGKQYPLPPGLGKFPIYFVKDYADKLPKKWVEEGGIFIPMYQREAMWISFEGEEWRPRAVKIGIGKVNVLTGDLWNPDLQKSKEQDYLVAPIPQPWLDGIKAGKGFIRQFVAMPLGKKITVEGQITGEETEGGLQIAVFNPKKGKFKKPKKKQFGKRENGFETGMPMLMQEKLASPTEMGLAAGGKMTQKVYPDPYGIETWDPKKFATIYIHIVNSEEFEKITGQKPPDTPVTKKDYELYNFPWFGLYDENYGDIKASEKLKNVKPVRSKKEESIKVKEESKYKIPPLPNP